MLRDWSSVNIASYIISYLSKLSSELQLLLIGVTDLILTAPFTLSWAKDIFKSRCVV